MSSSQVDKASAPIADLKIGHYKITRRVEALPGQAGVTN